MTSPPPARSSRRERFGKSIQRAYDKVVNKVQPISQPSSLHPGSSIASSTGGVSVSSTPSVVLGAQVGPSETLLRDYTSPGSPGWPTGSATVSDSVHTMRPETVFADRLKHTESAAISGLETALRILEKSAKAFPPLNSAVGGFIACLDIVQSAATNAEDYNQITQELITMADTLNNYVTDLGPEDSNNVAGRIARSIEVEVSRIEERRGRGKARRMIEAEDDKNDVIKCYRTIEGLFRQLHSDIAIRTWKNTNKLPLQHRMTLLQGMSPVDDARYNSSYSTTVKRRGCTPETREKVQADLQDWIRDPTGAKVYWMNGMAGTGKTTIAYSLCEWLEANKQLGASFFCSRVLSSCRNVNLIVPTIAYQLALTLQGYQSTLCQILEAHPGVSKLNVARQFEKLIQEPLLARKGIIPEGVVVVIDALDECEDEYGLRLMIGTLLKLAGNLTLKFFVTSRPEPAIRDNMMSIGGFSPAILHLHDIEESIVEGDIKKYLDDEFGPISLAPSKIDQLAKRAGNLFIYAATAARYILSGRGDPIDRLDAMLAMDSGSKYTDQYSKKYDEIDGLYTTILEAAISDEGLERVEVDRMQQVLWTVVCAKEPLTISALASLAGLAETQVRSSLNPLYSVLHVSSNRGLVSTLHASFPNFLFNPRRSQKQHCDESQHNMLLAHRCFDIMKNELKFNICGLKSSYEFDRDVPDLDHRIETCISSSLSYACQYWGEHLRSSRASDGLITMLVDFLGYRLLFWMEVLNLKKCVAKGIVALVNAQQWISASKSPSTTQQLAGDARDFVSRFAAGACSRSTPHIYISALPFCAKSGPIYAHYWGRTRGLMDMGGTAISQRDRAALATWKTSSTVLSVVFSPNSTSIASGSADGTVRVWDAYTGNVTAGPIEAHSASVYSVSFSPDSASVASASKDKTVRVWNTRTGELTAGPFVGHTSHVRSVAFSPDGARIVSGSDDQTIRVWDACTGDLVVQPFQGHTHHVNSVSFSPDGTLVVSGSHDMTVRVWDARTGGTAAEPFTGHTGPVRSVAFSPDGTSIASGSDDHSIRLWNTLNGDVVAGPFKGHTKGINSVLFSPDGLHIASGASDMTVQVWSVSTGISVGQINGHAGAVFSVAFSPDGAHIATGSGDLTIRVWNAHTPGFDTSLFESGHAQLVTSLSFSPDGTRIITGSGDHTIRLWDTHTGSLVAKPLVGHTGWISSVAFSRDGRRIVSGSEDTTLRVWDAQTGEIVGNPLKGHERWVMSVAFSPDSTLVVSGSQDQTIRLWDARKGDTVAGPLRGHTDNVNSVAFSPDGTLIVSGSDDMTILVWNIATGEVVVGPIEDHTNSVKSVAFSFDGTHIVSGSQDRTIRLWDARTGDSMAPPFRGHQGFVNSVAFSPDDALIVSGSDDKTIRVWDAQTGDVVAGPLRSHTGEINSVAFSPDGIHIASGSSDQAIRISYYRPYNANNRPYFQSPDPSSTAPSNDTSDAPELDYSVSPDKASTSTLGTTPISSQHRVQGTSNATGFQCHDDGWITSGGVALFWTPPDLRTHIPFPQDKLVMGHQGSLFINYDNLLLGEQWVECYNSSLSMF